MTLIKNFNTGVTLLSDKWNFCHWTQPTTFIETLGSIQTRYRERSSHIIIQRNLSDVILGWRQSLTNLLFCYLKCFLRVIASKKKVDLCKTKIKVRWKIMVSISVEYSLCKTSSNTEFFFPVFARIQSKCGKIRIRKNSVFGLFSRCDSEDILDFAKFNETFKVSSR